MKLPERNEDRRKKDRCFIPFQSLRRKELPLSILWNHWSLVQIFWFLPSDSPLRDATGYVVKIFDTHPTKW